MRQRNSTNLIHGDFSRRGRRRREAQRHAGNHRRAPAGIRTLLVPMLLAGAALVAVNYPTLIARIGNFAPMLTTGGGSEPGIRASFGFCHAGGGHNCVVDGDTFWLGGQKIRIADIDAPETHSFRCASEKALGDRATQRLHALLESGPITLRSIDRDEDTYGRKLRIVLVNGTSVGYALVGEGVARWYGNGRRPWC